MIYKGISLLKTAHMALWERILAISLEDDQHSSRQKGHDRRGLGRTTGIQKSLTYLSCSFCPYTEEHPLFGKYTGTFYKPMHVRGSLKEGLVIKDYNIHEK